MATTARIPLKHPSLDDLRSLDETSTDVCPLDNGRPAVASAVRVLEDAAVYVATRMHLGYGGVCRFVDLTSTDSVYLYVATEPFTAYATLRFGLAVDSSFSGSVQVTSADLSPLTESVDVSPVADYTDPDQMSEYEVVVPVGAGDSGDLATGVLVELQMFVVAGTLRLWHFSAHPVPLQAGSVVAI